MGSERKWTRRQVLVDGALGVGAGGPALELAPVEPAYFNPETHAFMTGGSTAVSGMFEPLRRAGATARRLLTEAAPEAWGVAPETLETAAGTVWHRPSGRRSRYEELAAAAALRPLPATVELKAPSRWRLIRSPLPRLDTAAQVDGSAVFGIDVVAAGAPPALSAAIRHCPVFGGTLEGVETAAAEARPRALPLTRHGLSLV